MKAPSVRVVALHCVDHPTVLATADIEVGNLFLVAGIVVIRETAEHPIHIQGPQISWRDEDLTRHYATCCKLRKPLRKLVLQALIARLQQEGVVL